MANKKFSNFEYASLTETGDPDSFGLHRYDAFETPHGHAFVIVSSDKNNEQQEDLCGITINRIKYYLENEPDESKDVAVGNALTYTGGYLYQLGQKDPLQQVGKISCLCVLFKDEKIYYSWVGNVELYLFTGKRMYLLSWKAGEPGKAKATENVENTLVEQHSFLGLHALITPHSGSGPVEPLNNDVLIISSGSVCRRLHTKDIKRVLQDSMPLQTKAARIMRQSSSVAGQCPSSIILLRFHDLKNTERRFGEGQVTAKHNMSIQKNEQTMAKKTETGKAPVNKSFRLFKTILSVIGLLVVFYFIYDLFIFDPHPPVPLPQRTELVLADTNEHVTEEKLDGVQPSDETPVLPEDVTYVVRSGDTWGRIYVRYGVCSWFIINHPQNTGRFGREGSLIAGERLRIPVKFSGKAEYNPHYYQEFATEKVGNRCENAGPDLLRTFEDKIDQ